MITLDYKCIELKKKKKFHSEYETDATLLSIHTRNFWMKQTPLSPTTYKTIKSIIILEYPYYKTCVAIK